MAYSTIINPDKISHKAEVTDMENDEYVVAQALSRVNSEEHTIYNESASNTYFLMGAENVNAESYLYGCSGAYTNGQGDVTVRSLSQTSDERIKDFRDDVDVDFDKLKSIPKKYFKWKDYPDGPREIGTSAQAVNEIYPEMVKYNAESDLYALDYSKLAIVALAAIDKLNDKIVKLEKIIKDNGLTEA